MANAKGKEVDTTSLSLDQAEKRGFIHRDYLAHCLRWSHVAAYLHLSKRYQVHHVLDVGCGKEAPLPKLLYHSRLTHTSGSYTGVDYGKVECPETIPKTNKFKAQFIGGFDFAKDPLPRAKYDTVVCFEVLEHVEPLHAYNMLVRMRSVLKSDGRAFISTPCYDEKTGAADNHVNEMTFQALYAMIGLAGLKIEKVYGTFASQKDYKKVMALEHRVVFDQLNEYYDSNVLACIFAPLYPSLSRNCLWVLSCDHIKTPGPDTIAAFKNPRNSNSTKWADHAAKILKASKAAGPL